MSPIQRGRRVKEGKKGSLVGGGKDGRGRKKGGGDWGDKNWGGWVGGANGLALPVLWVGGPGTGDQKTCGLLQNAQLNVVNQGDNTLNT